MYKSFHKTGNLAKLYKQNVIYIAYVGTHNNKDTFKYGKSSDVFKREYSSHRKTFQIFEMYEIYKTNYKDHVEVQLEHELKLRNLHTQLYFGKLQTELFQVNDTYSIDDIDRITRDIIKEHDAKDDKIIEYERIKLRQMELEYKMKLLDYKLKLSQISF